MDTGDFTVIVDGLQAIWCTNACIPYTGQSSDTVLIDNNGMVGVVTKMHLLASVKFVNV